LQLHEFLNDDLEVDISILLFEIVESVLGHCEEDEETKDGGFHGIVKLRLQIKNK
jgi:hypothetical protein